MTVRIIATIAVLVSAYVHLYEWLSGMRDVHVIGPLFIVNIVAGVVIAALLMTWKHWLAPFLAFGFGATTLGGFAIATTSGGLFGDHEKWQGPYVWVAAVAEAVAIIAGLYCLSRELRSTPARAVVPARQGHGASADRLR
jgi:MFS family permease